MSTTTVETAVALPISVNPQTWNADTAAMMEFAGLTWIDQRPDPDNPGQTISVRYYAPQGIMAGFIAACKRTGLDPTAKQIYASEINGRWTILVGIDGMRVVAQRTGEYDGQDPIEWQMTEGGEWSTTPGPGKPYAARISIYRKGISRPMTTTVTWAEFGDDDAKPKSNWGKRPCWMLGIRAESHGFRRLFPNDLAGLYTREDFATEAVDTSDALVISEVENYAALIESAETREEIKAVVDRARERNELSDAIRTAALTRYGMLARFEAEQDAGDDDPAQAEESAGETTDPAPPAEIACPVCGATGNENCTTVRGTDHKARIRAEIATLYPESESPAEPPIGETQEEDNAILACRDCLEGKHGACTGTAIVDVDPDSDPIEVVCACNASGHHPAATEEESAS